MATESNPSFRPSRARRPLGVAAAGALVLAVALGYGKEIQWSAPATPQPDGIATWVPLGTKGSDNYEVTVKPAQGESGQVSKVVTDLAIGEGLKQGSTRKSGIDVDQGTIADHLQTDAGGGVADGTTFEVHADHPVVDPSALRQDPTAEFKKVG